MFRTPLVFFFLVGLAVASSLNEQRPEDSCKNNCDKTYNGNEKVACNKACTKAQYIEEQSRDSNSTTCNESCVNNYHDNLAMTNACKHGCNAYMTATEDEPLSFLSYLMSLFGRLQNLSSTFMRIPNDENDSETTPGTNPKLRIMVVRRFLIRVPIESDGKGEAEDQAKSNPTIMPPDMMSGPFGELMHMVKNQEVEDTATLPTMPQTVMVSNNRPAVAACISYAARYLSSHPITVLFTVTLVALCIVLIAQLIVECNRRSRRANQFQFNQLPTYTEATTIKVPLETNFQDEPMTKTWKA